MNGQPVGGNQKSLEDSSTVTRGFPTRRNCLSTPASSTGQQLASFSSPSKCSSCLRGVAATT